MKELQVMQGLERSSGRNGKSASKRKRQRQRKRRMRQIRARLLRAAVVLLAVVLVYFVFRGGRFLVQKLTGTVSEGDSGFFSSDGLKEIFGENEPIVILDAGHGGNDQGTSAGKLIEKDINLKVAKLVEKKLKKEGIRVLMTRTDDSRVELSERSGLANDKGAALFVSIHCNYCEGSSKVQGLECYYEEGSDSGQALAEKFSRGFDGAAEVTNRGTKSDDFHVLRETKMPAVLIELGYLSNASEREKLDQKDYQEILAECIAKTISGADELHSGV